MLSQILRTDFSGLDLSDQNGESYESPGLGAELHTPVRSPRLPGQYSRSAPSIVRILLSASFFLCSNTSTSAVSAPKSAFRTPEPSPSASQTSKPWDFVVPPKIDLSTPLRSPKLPGHYSVYVVVNTYMI